MNSIWKSDGASLKRLLNTLLLIVIAASLAMGAGCSSSSEDVSQYAAPNGSSVESDSGVPAIRVDGVPAIPYEEGLEIDLQDTDAATGASKASDEKLTVRFIDVGQGDSALISCGGKNVLIDGGPSSASSKLYAILKDLKIDRLDYIIASHPDADHCGGIAGALNAAGCDVFFCSVDSYDTKTFNNILKYLGDVPVTIPNTGDAIELGPAVLRFVNSSSRFFDSNNGSLVCRLDYGDVSFLFTGDAETESEAAMLDSGVSLDVDVLKVAHHGSNSSSSVAFLNAVDPDYAVISVGENSYGHPTQEVISRLCALDIEVLRTDELGTITFETDGRDLSYESSKGIVQ